MFRIVLSTSVALLVLGYCHVSLGQHWGGHGGHFDFHNGHIDYHQPTHWDFHNGHFDLHRGHVDHIYPSVYSSNYYYPDSSIITGTTLYPNNTYYPSGTPSGTIVSSTPSMVSQPSSAPTNALPGNSVVTGYAPNQGPINISNPEKYGTALSFKLNGQTVRLEPGQNNSVKFDRNYIIEFHRGGEFGTAKYSLRDGDFQFVVGEKGWDLRKVQAEANPVPQIDNSVLQNPLPGK